MSISRILKPSVKYSTPGYLQSLKGRDKWKSTLRMWISRGWHTVCGTVTKVYRNVVKTKYPLLWSRVPSIYWMGFSFNHTSSRFQLPTQMTKVQILKMVVWWVERVTRYSMRISHTCVPRSDLSLLSETERVLVGNSKFVSCPGTSLPQVRSLKLLPFLVQPSWPMTVLRRSGSSNGTSRYSVVLQLFREDSYTFLILLLL